MAVYEMYEVSNPGSIRNKPDHIINANSLTAAKRAAKRLKMFHGTAIELYQGGRLVTTWWNKRWNDVEE